MEMRYDEKVKMWTNQARMETKMDGLTKQFTNHLRHHWAITIVLLGSTVTSVFGLLGLAVKLVFFS